MSPSTSTIKRLFAKSGNRCAFPRCVTPLTYNETLVGEICHIKGDKPGSPRHDPHQNDGERHSYDNLIILCPTHHTVIDDDEDAYTVVRLQRMKVEHERTSAPVSDDRAETIINNFTQQDVKTVGQMGGFAANTVHAHTINLQGPNPSEGVTSQRQLLAVENLWQTICRLGTAFSDIVFVETILLPEEIGRMFESDSWHPSLAHLRDYRTDRALINKFKEANASAMELERPFISPRLWAATSIIRAIYGRLAYLYQHSHKLQKYQDWRKDGGMDQLLRSALPVLTVAQARDTPLYGLRIAIDALEANFLEEAKLRRES